MTYNAGIPQPTDLISNSQAQILANFAQINSQFGGTTPTTGGDHDGFNNGSGNGTGMHNQVTFKANVSAPSLTRNSVAGVAGLYSNLVNLGSASGAGLFFQNATQNIQMTGPFSAAAEGYTTLPGGIILQWKNISIATTTGTWVFPYAYMSALWSVAIAPQQNITMWVSASSATGLTITRASSGASGCWAIVIGK